MSPREYADVDSTREMIHHRLVCFRCAIVYIGEEQEKSCKKCKRPMEKTGNPCKVVVVTGQWTKLRSTSGESW